MNKNFHSCILCGWRKDGNIHHFKFPKNAELRKLWIESCGLPESTNTTNSYLCARHFIESDFSKPPNDPNIKRHRLKQNAIPSVECLNKQNEKTSESVEEATLSHKVTRSCIICGFKQNNTERTSYFRFPKNETERKEWIDHFQIDSTIKLDNIRICSKHFSVESNCTIHQRLKKRFADITVDYGSQIKHVRPRYSEVSSHDSSQDRSSEEYQLPILEVLVNENCPAETVPMQEGSEDQSCEEKGHPSDELLVHETIVEDILSNFNTCPMQDAVESSVLRVSETEPTPFINDHSTTLSTVNCDASRMGYKSVGTQTSIHDIEEYTDSFSPVINNSSTGQSSIETPKRGQMQEHNYGRRKLKLYSEPRYPNDIRTPHMQSPGIARKSITILKDHLHRKTATIKKLRQKLYRSMEKIDDLETLISTLRSSSFVEEDVAQHLMAAVTRETLTTFSSMMDSKKTAKFPM